MVHAKEALTIEDLNVLAKSAFVVFTVLVFVFWHLIRLSYLVFKTISSVFLAISESISIYLLQSRGFRKFGRHLTVEKSTLFRFIRGRIKGPWY